LDECWSSVLDEPLRDLIRRFIDALAESDVVVTTCIDVLRCIVHLLVRISIATDFPFAHELIAQAARNPNWSNQIDKLGSLDEYQQYIGQATLESLSDRSCRTHVSSLLSLFDHRTQFELLSSLCHSPSAAWSPFQLTIASQVIRLIKDASIRGLKCDRDKSPFASSQLTGLLGSCLHGVLAGDQFKGTDCIDVIMCRLDLLSSTANAYRCIVLADRDNRTGVQSQRLRISALCNLIIIRLQALLEHPVAVRAEDSCHRSTIERQVTLVQQSIHCLAAAL